MDRLPGGIWCLHKLAEGKLLLSVCCAYVRNSFNTCTCISRNNIQFRLFEPAKIVGSYFSIYNQLYLSAGGCYE